MACNRPKPLCSPSCLSSLLLSSRAAMAAETAVKDALPPAPAGKTWKLVWHDEFDGTSSTKRSGTTGPTANARAAGGAARPCRLDGKGHLVISTFKDGDKFIDGCVTTQGKFEHAFGYYVARIKFQKQPGHWSAFWITGPGVGKVGDDGRDGTEIDIMEKPWLDDRVQHTFHWDGYGKDHKSEGKVVKVPGVMEGWHTFGLLVEARRVRLLRRRQGNLADARPAASARCRSTCC